MRKGIVWLSLSEKTRLEINGVDQRMFIKSKDIVMLFVLVRAAVLSAHPSDTHRVFALEPLFDGRAR